jgi:hypothetical protein
MITPVQGATLGTSATFQWAASSAATQYWLHVGSVPGGSDVYDQDRGTNLNALVSGLPQSTIYVRLFSLIGGVWEYRDYVYNFTPAVYDETLKAPKCDTPVAGCGSNTLLIGRDGISGGAEPHQPNTILNACSDGNYGEFHVDESNDVIRIFTQDGGVFRPGKTVRVEADVWVWAPAVDLIDVFAASDASNPSWTYVATVPALDFGVQTLSVTYALPVGDLQAVRVIFRYLGGVQTCGAVASYDDTDDLIFAVENATAQISSPAPGSTLPGSTVRFDWTAGVGVTQYWLHAGTSPGASDLVSQDAGTARNVTVSGLPLDSSVVYVRLWSFVDTWRFRDYTYTAAPNTTPAEMVLPSPGSILTSSTVTFQWTPGGSAVTQYWLHLGTSAGGNDILSQDLGLGVNRTLDNLPVNGNPVYVRLWSLSANAWIYRDYVYGTGLPATMSSPAPGTKFSGSSVTFQWNAGAAVTQYYVWAGSTAGSFDLANQDAGSSLSAAVNGLPMNGGTIYVRLWSLIDTWHYRDYTYTAAGP